MPILPDSPDQLYRQRRIAESFGEDAARYDRARPSYPAALVERIVAASPGRDFLDVGSGSGIAARLFQAAGCRVLGVEADARMAEFARRGGTEAEVSTFEAWDPAGRTFDAVVAGQAWHWVDAVAGAVKAAAVLRPGGLFAVFWNVHQPEPAAATAFAEVYDQLAPELQFYRQDLNADRTYSAFREPAERGLRAVGDAFSEPETWLYDWDRTYTHDEWLDAVPTQGGHSLLPPERLKDLLAGLGAAVDELGGSFVGHYATVAVTASRFPSSPARGEPNGPSAPTVSVDNDEEQAHTP